MTLLDAAFTSSHKRVIHPSSRETLGLYFQLLAKGSLLRVLYPYSWLQRSERNSYQLPFGRSVNLVAMPSYMTA